MKSYVFSNNNTNFLDVIKRLTEILKLDIIDRSDSCYTLGNRDIIIDVDKKKTQILLLDESTNIKKVREYFMEK